MHPSLTSREEDLAAAPKHQALLTNLGVGPLLKSQTHAAALHQSLRSGSNDHARNSAPSDPKGFIRRASPDMTLTTEQRQRARREESRQDADQLRRMSEARSNGGINDEAETAYMRKLAERGRANRGKSGSRGAFDKLRAKVREHLAGSEPMTKAQPVEHNQSFESRYGCAAYVTEPVTIQRATVAKIAAPAAARHSIASIRKSIADVAKSLGNTALSKSLEAGYGADSATLTGGSAIRKQSLPKKPAAKPLSPDELLKAASTLLHQGRIDTQTAARVQSEVNLTGKVSPVIMKTLSEACK
jgi:hypothetical protein